MVKNPGKVMSTYHNRIHKKIKGIEFLLRHANAEVSWNDRKVAQLVALQSDLRAQFQRMEAAWDDMRIDPLHEPFELLDEVEMYVNTAGVTVTTALLESGTFLEEKGTPDQSLVQAGWVEVAPAAEPIPRDPQVRWWLELVQEEGSAGGGRSLLARGLLVQAG
jgi:hypothetical protein